MYTAHGDKYTRSLTGLLPLALHALLGSCQVSDWLVPRRWLEPSINFTHAKARFGKNTIAEWWECGLRG